ncbi:hypothetical protein IV203_035539 [Nitzschia inconspicua]|uniref:Uncharacterized protein n=1 Tax=Nitzschia inconspicua TaxID=303405 RepID=A0A9K3LDG7_9STRA|nr:hypothetical protein IV203_035539 [Nitzschia inconspicua]
MTKNDITVPVLDLDTVDDVAVTPSTISDLGGGPVTALSTPNRRGYFGWEMDTLTARTIFRTPSPKKAICQPEYKRPENECRVKVMDANETLTDASLNKKKKRRWRADQIAVYSSLTD